ncbi:MAG TPA: hypothetical protein VKS60_01865, partial [Stellaceae bacterium]|nr:hypothetical protein [Stellaceae bacterium]
DQWQRKAGSVVRDLLVTAHRCYMDSYRRWECIDGCFPHDSIAVFAAVHPDRFVEVRGRVEVVTDGPERGRTRLIPDDSSHIGVAMGGRLKFVREFLDSMEF